MKTNDTNRSWRLARVSKPAAAQGGLTILEMLVSITLLVFIVVGLTAMFVETQRIFKAGVKQSSMTDAGQTIMDLVSSDLVQVSDAQEPGAIFNLYWGWLGTNTSVQYQDVPANVYRTNQLEYIFGLVQTNNEWLGVGYAVSNNAGGAGTLYRFVYSVSAPLANNVLFETFSNALFGLRPFDANYFHRVADGVVHLKMRAFDSYGNESIFSLGQDFAPGNPTFYYPVPGYTNSLNLPVPAAALPNTVQLEVGVLEPDAYDQLRSLPNPNSQRTYLGTAGGKIQIYRQNIAIAGATR